jgi:sugar/nucleoside kinase (ribokinase family)
MTDVVVCGPASWNQIVYLRELPPPRPHAVFAQAAYDTLGATSAGKALHLTDLGRPVTLHTRVGDDETGDRILATLQRAGVATVAERVPGPSERHLNLMTAVRGDLPVWTDLHDYDGRADFHRPFIDVATHVFVSADGLAEPVAFLHRLVDEGVAVAVCTRGADGALAVDRDHREWRVEATAVDDVVDTNGAGDAFFAGVLHATLDGAELVEALRAGSRQAARALESPHLSPLVSLA